MTWLPGWYYRKPIAISASNVESSLADFPLCVPLSRSDVNFHQGVTSGADLRFTASDGVTLLAHEWTDWHDDGGSGAFVKIPSISATTGATFYVYYGNPSASDATDKATVWADYAIAHHLDDYVSGQVDSAGGYAWNGSGGQTATTGVVGGGVYLEGDHLETDTNSDAIAAQLNNSGMGVSVILKDWDTAVSTNFYLMRFRTPAGGEDGWDLQLRPGTKQLVTNCRSNGASNWLSGASGLLDGATAHLASTALLDGSNLVSKGFVNGSMVDLDQTATSDTALNFVSGSDYCRIGWNSIYSIRGVVDEVRVRKIATSDDWIKFEHANLMSVGNQITLDTEESLPVVPRPYTVDRAGTFQTDVLQAETFIPGIFAGHTHGI